MLKLRAVFDRKENQFEAKDCVVEKVVALSGEQFDDFCSNMLRDRDFIAENRDLMYMDRSGAYHCILVTGEDRPDGVLIECEGYDYARYASLLPRAADLLKAERTEELLNNTLDYISEMNRGEELYHTLSESIGMTNGEIGQAGFCLEEYYGPEPESGPTLE